MTAALKTNGLPGFSATAQDGMMSVRPGDGKSRHICRPTSELPRRRHEFPVRARPVRVRVALMEFALNRSSVSLSAMRRGHPFHHVTTGHVEHAERRPTLLVN